MKRILLTILLILTFASPGWAINKIIDLPLGSDFVDTKSVLATGQIKRVSAATKISGGVLSTCRGNRTNLIEQSEDFDTWWSKANITISTGISDPDGGTDARYMKADATVTQVRYLIRLGMMDTSSFYILSVYAKKADINYLMLRTRSHANILLTSSFNLSTGAWETTGHGTAGVTDEGDGWYRVWVLIDSEAGATADFVRLHMTSTDDTVSYAGTLGEGIYIYGAQLEKLEGPESAPGAELIDDVNNRTFAAASDWTNVDINAYNEEAGDLTITASAADQYCTLAVAEAPMTGYQAYLLEFDVANIVATWTVSDFDAGYEIGTISANGANQQIVFSYADASTGGLRITSVAANSSMDFDNVSLKEVTFGGPLEPGPYTATAGATATIPAVGQFEDDWLRIEGEGTNQCLHSRDLSNAAWVKTNCTGAKTQVGVDGVANSASLLTASANNATCLQTLSLTSTAKTYSVYIKRSVGSGAISITDNNGTNYTACASISSTDFTQYEITRTQANPVIGIKVAVDTDAIIVDLNQLEETAHSTSAVHTTTCPATRTTAAGSSADNGVSWTLAQTLKNLLDDTKPGGSPTDSQGTLLFDVKWLCDESNIAAENRGLVSVANFAFGPAYHDQTFFKIYDHTSATAVSHPAFTSGDIISYAARWGDFDGNANNLSVGLREDEGVWAFGTAGAYDGAFALGTKLRLAYSNEYPFKIRNIQFWDEPWEKVKTLISGSGVTTKYGIVDTSSGGYFDAVKVTGASNVFKNCTFYSPFGIAFDADETCVVTNCILEGIDKDIDIANTKTATGKNNCLQHHTGATNNIGDGTYTNTDSVFAQDPLFTDPSSQDFTLQSTSPCINRGTDAELGDQTDVDGDDLYGAVDIGAQEYQQSENAIWFNNSTGDNSNTSISSSVPFLTFDYLSRLGLADGCTVYLRGGQTWADNFDAPSPGFSGGVITLKSYGSGGPAILTGGLNFDEEYWEVEGIEFR